MSAATVLLSGGLDSSTLLAQTLEAGFEAHALVIDYGQRHKREIVAADAVAQHYGVPLHIASIGALGLVLSGSSLTSAGVEVPEGHYTDESMAATVVPNRNAILLSVAAGYAAARGHEYVATAVHEGDHPIYPDCRPEFISAISQAVELACGVYVRAPFLLWDKRDIARLAVALEVPVQLTWSCYRGEDRHCGRCGTCVERAEALDAATCGQDPTEYADADFWRGAVR